MDLTTKIRGLGAIGWGNAFRAVTYAIRRDRLDRKYAARPSTGRSESPGSLLGADTDAGGGIFRFENVKLEIRYLTDDMVRVTWYRGSLPEPYTLTDRDFPGAEPELSGGANQWSLRSPGLQVEVDLFGGLTFLGSRGNLVRSDAEARGCLAEVEAARDILARGTSAHRQLAVYREALAQGADERKALHAVVDWLIEETLEGVS